MNTKTAFVFVRRARLAVLALLGAALGMGMAAATANAAGTYDALLPATGSGGWSYAPVVSGSASWNTRGLMLTKSFANANVSRSTIWDAPSGTEFEGFGYTAATFAANAVKPPGVGGLAGGIVALNTAGDEVLFPGADDCEIVASNHYWVASAVSGATDRPTGLADDQVDCNTSGVLSWTTDALETGTGNQNFDNTPLTELALSIDCTTNTNCYSGSNAEAAVDNFSVQLKDSNSQPSISAPLGWTSSANVKRGSWYSTLSSAASPSLTLGASDPSGICYLSVVYAGSSGGISGSSGDIVGLPSTVTEATPIGAEFSSEVPCDTATSYTYTLPGSLTSGVYSLSAKIANAPEYEAGNFSGTDAVTVAGTPTPTIDIDNTAPTVGVYATARSTAELAVTTGPSGVGSVNCTVNGSATTATFLAGDRSASGKTQWSVALPTGTDKLACTAEDDDANAALGASTAESYDVSSDGTVSPSSSGSTVGSVSEIISAGQRCTRSKGKLRCVEVDPTAANHTLTLGYGRRTRLTGVVKTKAGRPLRNAQVQITAHVNGYARSIRKWTTTTNGTGRFLFMVPAGPSRTITVVAANTETIFHERTNSAIRVGTAGVAKAGHRFYVTGQVLGGYLPGGGAILTVDYFTSGMAGYASLGGVYHSSASGRFKIRIPLNGDDVGRTYKIWVETVTEPDWPYRGGRSRTLTIKVR